MNKTKSLLIVFLASLAIIASLYLLSLKKPMDAKMVVKAADDYKIVMKYLKGNPPDFANAEKVYMKSISPIFKIIDKKERRRINGNIIDALTQGPHGNIPNIAVQIIDKKIQQGFFQLLIAELESMKEPKVNLTESIERAKAAISVIEPSLIFWSKWVDDHDALHKRFTSQFDKVKTLAQNNPTDLDQAATALIKTIKSAYLVGVLYGVTGIEENQSSDKHFALEKIALAKLCYNFFMEDHARINLEDSIMVEGEFRNKPGKVNTLFVRDKLQEAFSAFFPDLPKEIYHRPEETFAEPTKGQTPTPS